MHHPADSTRRAFQLVVESRENDETGRAAVQPVAPLLGRGNEMVRHRMEKPGLGAGLCRFPAAPKRKIPLLNGKKTFQHSQSRFRGLLGMELHALNILFARHRTYVLATVKNRGIPVRFMERICAIRMHEIVRSVREKSG